MAELFCRTVATPLGEFVLVADENHLLKAEFLDNDRQIAREPEELIHPGNNPILELAAAELEAYFQGTLREFSVPCRWQTTPFRQKVWSELTRIPYGQTISYQELACRIGDLKACRAVGQANHHNPLAIIVPCHRVIGKDGKLVGYGGGLHRKSWLLDWEKEQMEGCRRLTKKSQGHLGRDRVG